MIYISEPVLLQMIHRFMEFVETPFPGYRLLPQYAHIVSDAPSGGGRLVTDSNGRPSENVLSAFYLGFGSKCNEAQRECERNERYPGHSTRTTFHTADPHNLLLQMQREDRQ